MHRENWGTRFGFIMATAGSAVGLGNIWRFPYTTGQEGGGAFLLIYLACIAVLGLAVVMAELVVGRSTQRNPVGAFKKLGGGQWPHVGMMGVIAGFVILSFYIVVAGWTIAYIFLMARGVLSDPTAVNLEKVFTDFITNPYEPVLYASVFMGLCAMVVLKGVGAGIERASKIFMPVMFAILIVLVIRSITLPGAEEGIRFFLIPDWSKVSADTFTAALGQAFFSLSLGMGALITYGSYMPKDHNLPADAAMVVTLDTSVAVLAGFVILPAVFAAGLSPGAGPGLTFITLPAVFAAIPAGQIFGILFFILLAIAALTSAVSLLEVVVAYFVDEHKYSRRKATVIVSAICLGLGIPSSLSLGVWDFKIWDKGFMDWMEYLAVNLMLPIGAMLTSLFVGWRLGPKAVKAITNDGTLNIPATGLWLFILRYVAPLGILWILISGLN